MISIYDLIFLQFDILTIWYKTAESQKYYRVYSK